MNAETKLQNEIRIALSKHGVVFRMNVGVFLSEDGRRISSGLPAGTSDLLFVGAGYIAWIEVKTETGRATEKQKRFIKKMKSLGHRAGIARSVADALEIIGKGVGECKPNERAHADELTRNV